MNGFWRSSSSTENDKNDHKNYQKLSQSPELNTQTSTSSLTSSLSSFNIFGSSFTSRLPGNSVSVNSNNSPGGSNHGSVSNVQGQTSVTSYDGHTISRGNKTVSANSGASVTSVQSNSSIEQRVPHPHPTDSNSGSDHKNVKSTKSFENYSNNTEDAWDVTDLDMEISNQSSSNRKTRPINNPISTQPTSLTIQRDSTLSPSLQALNQVKQNREREVTSSASPSTSQNTRLSPGKSGLGANHLQAVQLAAKQVINARRKSESKPDESSSPQKTAHSPSLSSSHRANTKNRASDLSPTSPTSIPNPEDQIKNLESLNAALPNYHNSSTDTFDDQKMPDNISQKEKNRMARFANLMQIPNLEIAILRKAAWSGIPNSYRGDTWRLLCGYMPCSIDRRKAALREGVDRTLR